MEAVDKITGKSEQMSEEKTNENELLRELEQNTADNDDIIDFIQDDSLSALKSRFGSVEEDKEIRNGDFNPLVSGKNTKKKNRHDDRKNPSFKKDILSEESRSQLQSEFGSAESDFDNDAIGFDEIDLEALGDMTLKEKPAEFDGKDFDTNTRVIYSDNTLDDGIKRNTDIEVSDVFLNSDN